LAGLAVPITRAPRHCELNGGAADSAGGAVDEQRAPGPDAERVQGARGRLEGDGQACGLGTMPVTSRPIVCGSSAPIRPCALSSRSIDAGRVRRDPDLAGPGLRIRKIHDLKDLRDPELAEADCLHHSLRSRPWGVAPV
jgi:hypothetical protein